MPVDLTNAVVGWLVGVLGDAGLRLIRGSRDDRLLRKAVRWAVNSVVAQVDPAFQDALRRMLKQCFSTKPKLRPDVSMPVGVLLRSAIKGQVVEASHWINSDTGRLFSEEVPVNMDWLAQQVTDAIVEAMRQVVAEDGLAELVHGVDISDVLGRTADVVDRLDAIGLTVGQLATGPAVLAGEAFAAARREYLGRLRQRFRRMDLEILTPLTEQDEHPEMLLGRVFVPQTVRADPPPVELPREVWRRLSAAGELRDSDLPGELEQEALDRLQRTYQDRPARHVLDVVAEPAGSNVVVLGDPGAGKSTLARYLMLILAGGAEAASSDAESGRLAGLAGWLPLLVELRSYADPRWREGTFLDMQGYLYDSEGMGLPRDGLAAFLREGGRALVVFDGLDEIFDPWLREQVTRQIEGFAARYRQARVVVTSRLIGYQRAILDAAGFSHYMLQDLDIGQIREFTAAWFHSSCPGNPAEAARLGSRLLNAIQNSAAVAELAGNPMLLTILAIIGRRRELPRDRRTVYQHAVSVLVEHWDATGKHLHDERVDSGMPYLRHEDKLELLRLVAHRMQAGRSGLSGNYLPGPDLLSEFRVYLQERFELPADRAIPAAAAMLGQLRERNFILAQFGAGIYGFVHRAFLEYLAATDICEHFSQRELNEDELIGVVGRRWADPAWQEVLLLITGMISEKFAARVIDRLLEADSAWSLRPDPLPRHILLAVRCLGEVRKPGLLAAQSRAVARALISVFELAAADPRLMANQPLASTFEKTVLPVLAVLGPNWAGRQQYEDWYLGRGQSGPGRPGR